MSREKQLKTVLKDKTGVNLFWFPCGDNEQQTTS